MTNNDAEQTVDSVEAEVEALESKTDAEKDTTDWKAKYEETAGRLKRAETKLDKKKIEDRAEEIVEKRSKSGDLDETQLDYLDLKGINEDEDVKIIQRHVRNTGETVRQALKDDYVVAKLAANKEKREVSDATPSSTKRTGGGQTTSLSNAIAKFEATGKLPEDFKLATEVTNAIASRGSSKPSWH